MEAIIGTQRNHFKAKTVNLEWRDRQTDPCIELRYAKLKRRFHQDDLKLEPTGAGSNIMYHNVYRERISEFL